MDAMTKIAEMPDGARSATMRAVKAKDTTPELRVRRLLHSMGYRFRLHRKDLPGVPDIVFGRRRRVIFVHGCFWHSHKCRRGSRVPVSNREYWQAKIGGNVQRDAAVIAALKAIGWSVLVVWECETGNANRAELRRTLREFLGELS